MGFRWGVLLLVLSAGCASAPTDIGSDEQALGTTMTLATNQPQPGDIVVDARDVYFIDYGTGVADGSIRRVSKNGGTVTILAAGESVPRGLAVDSTNVYWAANLPSSGSIRTVAKSGGEVSSLADGLEYVTALTADDYDLYFVSGGSWKVLSKSGGLPWSIAPAECVTAAVNDASNLYFTENCVLFPPQGIFTVSKLGGVPLPISTDAPGGLAVDSTRLYWVDRGDVKEQYKLTAFPFVLANIGEFGSVAAADSDNVYALTGGVLFRVSKSSGAVTKLYEGNPSFVASDGTALYLDEPGDAANLYRVTP